jgi:hypothetical protein
MKHHDPEDVCTLKVCSNTRQEIIKCDKMKGIRKSQDIIQAKH